MSSVKRENVTSGECGRGTEEVSRGREEAERGCSVASPASEVPEPPWGSETPRLHGPHGACLSLVRSRQVGQSAQERDEGEEVTPREAHDGLVGAGPTRPHVLVPLAS